MQEDDGRLGPFRDRVEDFEHSNKTVVWLQLGDVRHDDHVSRPVRIVLTSQSNLFDEICKLHPFRDWGAKVFAKRKVSTDQRGGPVPGLSDTEYERGWTEDWTRQNMAQLQTWLLAHPSREACYITMMNPRNLVDAVRISPQQENEGFTYTSSDLDKKELRELLAQLALLATMADHVVKQ
jgi:hypothetical protein